MSCVARVAIGTFMREFDHHIIGFVSIRGPLFYISTSAKLTSTVYSPHVPGTDYSYSYRFSMQVARWYKFSRE